jgi:tRNA(Ile)-lysidine synthase
VTGEASVVATAVATLRRHAMLAGGETVVIGVSGGADSTALLHVLLRIAPEWRLGLHVVHVDHGLRPESARDAEFVRQLCTRLGVAVEVVPVAVEARGSPEAAARAARYAALEAWADRLGAARIALGHTADDQAETVLMRVMEGTGLRGLAAIPPVRGRIIRPLIEVRRAAILDLLESAGQAWVEDASNRDVRFTRNRIRHEVVPRLAAGTSVDLVDSLARVAARARAAARAVERAGAAELDRLAVPGEGALVLPRSSLVALPRTLAGEVLRLAAERLDGRADLRAWQHEGLRRILAAPPPRRPFRLGGVTFEVSGDLVRVGRGSPAPLRPRPLPVPGRVELDEVGLAIAARAVADRPARVPREGARVVFDAAVLPGPLLVRARRPGDRLRPFGSGESRRLKPLLIDARVPRWERDRVPIVVDGRGDIAWVAGIRRGAQAPLTASTRSVVELVLEPQEGTGSDTS